MVKKSGLIILILSASLFLPACFKQQPIVTPWDLLHSKPHEQLKLRVAPADFGRRLQYPVQQGFEMWYTDVLCSNGMTLLIYFKIGRLYRGSSSKAEVAIQLYQPGKPYLIKKVTTDDFEASPDSCDVRVGKSRLFGTYPHYNLRLQIEDIQLNLALKGVIRGYKLSDNKVYFGENPKQFFNEWIVTLPRAYAQGTLMLHQQTIPISGDVYLDHWLGNAPLNVLYAQCHWGKIYAERYTLIFLSAYAARSYQHQPLGFLMLFDQDNLIAATDRISLETITRQYSAVTNETYPTRFTITIDSPEVKGRVHCSPRHILAEINHVKKSLGAASPYLFPLARLFFGAPYSYGILSQARAKLQVKGESISFTGQMFHEIDNKKAHL
ncbi:hypothetical protein ACFL27_26285 [candidate division CSSED10-310 bacterium]|uniref:AttH domain-containing protein n=1 Tax=candidate division CSSED10-310 bacterium TaxID=2855610 RepID=A0ABV6Z5I6_UNCC1